MKFSDNSKGKVKAIILFPLRANELTPEDAFCSIQSKSLGKLKLLSDIFFTFTTKLKIMAVSSNTKAVLEVTDVV